MRKTREACFPKFWQELPLKHPERAQDVRWTSVSTDYLLMGKDHDKVDSRTKLLDVVAQLTEIAKSL